MQKNTPQKDSVKAGKIKLSLYELTNTEHSHAVAETAVKLARGRKVSMLMKGSLHTAILVLNSGSSSLKFSLFAPDKDALQRIVYGEIEALDEKPYFWIKDTADKLLYKQTDFDTSFKTDRQTSAITTILEWIQKNLSNYTLTAAGHRVVHGGDKFTKPTVINDHVLQQLELLDPLAPLHQPFNIAGIRALKQQNAALFQVACFDTEFHTTQPPVAQAFALPASLPSPIAIKRYGFHGLSYEYIAEVLPSHLGAQADGKIVVAHLGHGASMCAMQNRQSIATTMGFTALDGLPMGTRCGNLDPGVVTYLMQQGMSYDDITQLLYNQSGLLGVSGISSDMRTLLQSADPKAKFALDLFVYQITRQLGSLAAALDGLDGLIFTGGIGENAAAIRASVCAQAEWLGVRLNTQANQQNLAKISASDSKVFVYTIPTNEELVIAQHTWGLWQQH